MNASSAAGNVFIKTGNTMFIRPLQNGPVAAEGTKETTLFRKPSGGARSMPAPTPWPTGLEKMPLPMLLQTLGDWQKSATLRIYSNPYLGKICLRRGKVCFASITNLLAPLSPYKAFHRILSWKNGTLKLDWGDPTFQNDEIYEDISVLLRENASRRDELSTSQSQLPPNTHLKVASLPGNIDDLTSPEVDVLQMVMAGKTVQEILDTCAFPDLETYRLLLRLYNQRFLSRIEPA